MSLHTCLQGAYEKFLEREELTHVITLLHNLNAYKLLLLAYRLGGTFVMTGTVMFALHDDHPRRSNDGALGVVRDSRH